METLLYVDDEEMNLFIFETIFKNKYNIITCDNIGEAFKSLEQNKGIIAVFTDMQMPDMTGLEFISIVKLSTPHIPCYVLTGFDPTTEMLMAVESGLVKRFFKKPLDPNDIKAEIESLNKA